MVVAAGVRAKEGTSFISVFSGWATTRVLAVFPMLMPRSPRGHSLDARDIVVIIVAVTSTSRIVVFLIWVYTLAVFAP